MSEENVEIIRRAYEAYERGDLDAAVADIAPDVSTSRQEPFRDAPAPTGGLRATRTLWRGWTRSSATPTRKSTP